MIKTEKYLLMARHLDKILREHFWSNASKAIQCFDDLDNNECEQIIETAKTLILARDGVHLYPGHFVDAVLKNDLSEAFNRADEINLKAIYWYVLLINNIEKLNR